MNARLVELWNAGVPVKEIAKELGCSENTVHGYANRHRDICFKRKTGRKQKVDETKLVELWNARVPVKEIAKELGCSEPVVYGYVNRHRDICFKRKTGKKQKVDETKLVELWNAGMPVAEIAKELGCSENTIYVYKNRLRDICSKRETGMKKFGYNQGKINKDRLVKLWNSGVPVQEIAKEFGCSRQAIYVYVEKHQDIFSDRGSSNRAKIDEDKFVKLWNAGISREEIAKELGCSEKTVSRYANSYLDICLKRKKGGKEKVDKTKLVKLWNDGVPVKEIARELGCAIYTVSRYANSHLDICLKRKKGGKEKVDKAKLVKLWNDGVPVKEIARELGCTIHTVSRYANNHQDLCPKREKNKKDKVYNIKLVELWNAGVPVEEIAKELGCSKENVYSYASRNRNVCANRGRSDNEKVDKAKLADFWNNGVSVAEIAKKFGCSEAAVYGYARRNPELFSKRSKGAKEKVDKAKLTELWNAKVPVNEIAKELKCNKRTVYSYVRNNREVCLKRK